MDRIEALEQINETWNNTDLTLAEKVTSISNWFYSVGLDLESTAAFIKATPAELDALLSLGALDEGLIEMISAVNPQKTTWMFFANANDDQIKQAVNALAHQKETSNETQNHSSVSEYVYQQMIDVSGPTPIQLVAMLSGNDLGHVLKKAQSFSVLSKWENKFFNGIVAQKRRGKALSDKQLPILVRVLNDLADRAVIKRNSIDGDQEICDRVLDAIGR